MVRDERLCPNLHAMIKAAVHARKSVKNNRRDLLLAVLKDSQSVLKQNLKEFRYQTSEKLSMDLYRCLAESLGKYHGTWSNVKC